MSRAEKSKDEEKKKSKKLLLLLLLLLLIIFAVWYFCFYNKGQGKITFGNAPGKVQELDEDAGDYQEEKDLSNNGKNVVMPGWGTIKIKANTKEITKGIDFFNPKANDGYYYLKFQLIVDDEVLYESGLVAPDKHIQKITLSKPLKEGTYDAIIFIQPYKWDRQTPTNNGQVRVKLEVSS